MWRSVAARMHSTTWPIQNFVGSYPYGPLGRGMNVRYGLKEIDKDPWAPTRKCGIV